MPAPRPRLRAIAAAAPTRCLTSSSKSSSKAAPSSSRPPAGRQRARLTSTGGPGTLPMTYCVALRLNRGLVFAADTRTNAGVDNIAQFRKIHYWRQPGERVLVLLAAGNLSLTQSVVSLLNEQLVEPRRARRSQPATTCRRCIAPRASSAMPCAASAPSTARRWKRPRPAFPARFILGGQIGTEPPRLFQIYSEGNFIEATDDTPYFQIGEHKYGKPILDRVAQPTMRLGEAAKLILLASIRRCAPTYRSACRSTSSSTSAIASTCAARSASSRTTSTSRSCRPPGRKRCARRSPRSKNSTCSAARLDAQFCAAEVRLSRNCHPTAR